DGEVMGHGWGSKAGGHAFDRFRSADTQLMSAPSSPGWTWSLLVTERWLFVYPPASAAAFFCRRRGGFDLSGPDRPRSPAFWAHSGNEGDSRRQRPVERLDDWKL